MPVNSFAAYPGGFPYGLTVRNLPVLNTHAGNVFWVDSGIGNDSGAHDGTVNRPFATIDYAVGRCTANNGDIIMVAPGHTETISAAGSLDLDVAGIRVVGQGNGRDRPTLSFTATGSDVDIDAANITIENFIWDVTGVDAVVGALDVNQADFTLLGCEVIGSGASAQMTEFIVTATAANRMRVIGNVFRSPDVGANNVISIEGTPDGIEIAYNHIYGAFADACIHNPTSNVATNVKIHHNYLQNDQNGDHAIELVSAVTGVIHDNMLVTDAIATAADWGACQNFNNKYADDGDADVKAVDIPLTSATGSTQDLTNVIDALYGTTGIGSFPNAAVPANDVSLAEVMRDIWAGIGGTAAGENGIQTFPSAAAPANNVSLAEVVRSIYDAVAADSAATTTVHSQLGRRVTKVGDLAADPDDLFTVTGKCLITLMVGECTSVVATTTSLSLNTSTNGVVIAASTDVVGDAAGALYIVTGDPDEGLNGQASGADTNVDVARSRSGHMAPFMINDDKIYSNLDGAGTGTIQWDLYYIPLEASASIASSA